MQPLDPEPNTETSGRAAWERWAADELRLDEHLASAAVDAAMSHLRLGSTPAAAVVAAKVSAGQPVSRPEIESLYEEVKTVHQVSAELESIVHSGELTKAALAQLRQQFQSREDALDVAYKAALDMLTPTPTSASHATTQSPPGPSIQEFFADNSILVISIAGAFLLIVATLLFEIYGTSGFGGEVRFGGVFALDLVFGAAGYFCLRRPKLRIVGQTYVVIFALMAPLTVAAAYVFLGLQEQGISVNLAVGLGGSSCAVLYAILAHRLQSRGYALMSLVALAVGAVGLVRAFNGGIWSSAWITSLVFVYIVIAYPPSVLRPIAVFQRVAEPFIHVAALFSFSWSLVQALSLRFAFEPTQNFQLPATTALLTAAYALYCWRAHRTWMLWAVWTGVSLTVVSANDPLGFGQRGLVVELAALAWAYAIGRRYMPGSGLRGFLKLGAAVQAAIPVLASASPDGLQAAALFATAGVGVLLALQEKRPAWLLLAVGIFSVDWFWLAKSLLPPPEYPTMDTLVLTYSPLAAIYLGLGIALRQTRRERWAWPFYAWGLLLAIGVPIAASTQGDLTLAGRSLVVYSGVSYVAAALHRFWPGLVASVGAAAISVLLLLAAASAATYSYPLAMSAVAAIAYGAHLAWGKGDNARAHRVTGLAIAGMTALLCFRVPMFWDTGAAGAATSFIALITLALLVLIDGRLTNRLVLDYVAAVVASAGGFWLGRYFGVGNPQAYVALPGLVLISSGLMAPRDLRLNVNRNLCRAAIGLGAFALMATSAVQSVRSWSGSAEDAASGYLILWVIEAIAALLVGIGFRSRTLVIAGGIGLGLGAIRALVLILESVQVYVVFGVIAILLLVGAGLLASVRDRIGTARSAMTQSWRDWT